MTYRDDREADRARIAALEAELAATKKELAGGGQRSMALAHAGGNAIAVASGGRVPWYGAPLQLELARTFDGEFPRDQLEDLVDVIRGLTHEPGRSELLKSSLTWSANANPRSTGPFTVVSVSVREGKTRLQVTDHLGQLAGAVYGGLGGGVGGCGFAVPIFAFLTTPVLIPIGIAGWLGSVFFGARWIFKRAARRRAEGVQAVFVALSMEIARKLPAP